MPLLSSWTWFSRNVSSNTQSKSSRSHSKVRKLGRWEEGGGAGEGAGGFTKNVMKSGTGGRDAARKVMSLTQNFSLTNFLPTQFSLLCISFSSKNIAVISNNKNIQNVICVSEIAISSLLKHYNSTVLPIWHINACASRCKSERSHWFEKQFLTFSTSFDVMWYA